MSIKSVIVVTRITNDCALELVKVVRFSFETDAHAAAALNDTLTALNDDLYSYIDYSWWKYFAESMKSMRSESYSVEKEKLLNISKSIIIFFINFNKKS